MIKQRASFVLLSALLLCVLLALAPRTALEAASASSSELAALEDKLATAAAQRKEAEKAVENAETSRADAITQKGAIDAKILALGTELETLERVIAGYQTQIDEKNIEITDETLLLEKQYQILRTRIRVNYEDGGTNLIAILFDSDGLIEFFKQMDRYESMLDYDEELMSSYNASIVSLNAMKTGLENDKATLDQKKVLLEDGLSQLNADRLKADKLVTDAESDLTTATANLDKITAEEKKYNDERENKLAELQKSSNQSYIGGEFLWPLPQKYTKVSCGFGWRIHPVTGKQQFHLGIDIPAPYGTEIYSVNDGTVVEVSYNYADGYFVTVSHGGGVASFYSHLSKYLVKVGDKVKRGQVIAYVGTSGYVTGAHLNLNVYENNTAVNPLTYFQ